MPQRIYISQELAKLLGVLSHPDRIRLVGELRQEERDVNTLRERLGLTQARVSQQLALLRAHRLVRIRRDGRHIFYRLSQPTLVDWLIDGLRFVEGEPTTTADLRIALMQARDLWTAGRQPAEAAEQEAPEAAAERAAASAD
ncbi:MAG: helix-turn-helix transcriptional regulator [Bryobacterales bacterium]|nr:helix-turn-helix transcriptional regulator [Bryobacterales bacterium]